MATNAPKIVAPTINLPTGFEKDQNAILLKQQMGQQLLENSGKANPNMTSWAQVLGQLAEAWAGKSIASDAAKSQDELGERVRRAYATSLENYFRDRNSGMAPMELEQKYAMDPFLTKEVERAGNLVDDGQKITTFGGKGVYKKDTLGKYENKPDSSIWTQDDGTISINPLVATMSAIRAGTQVPDQYPTTARLPGTGPAVVPTTPAPSVSNKIPFGNPLNPGIAKLPPPVAVVGGKPYWVINGKYYDNPEGR